MNNINKTLKVRKVLVKVISFGCISEKLRVTLYDFCAPHYRVKDENLITKYIPKDLRNPNSEFMMVWKQN